MAFNKRKAHTHTHTQDEGEREREHLVILSPLSKMGRKNVTFLISLNSQQHTHKHKNKKYS